MKAYIWRKKKEYVSDVESVNYNYLYKYIGGKLNGTVVLSHLFVKIPTKSGYIYSPEKLESYVFTEKEIDEILPNTKHMFDKLNYEVNKYGEVIVKDGTIDEMSDVPKIKLDSLYGEINETEVNYYG